MVGYSGWHTAGHSTMSVVSSIGPRSSWASVRRRSSAWSRSFPRKVCTEPIWSGKDSR